MATDMWTDPFAAYSGTSDGGCVYGKFDAPKNKTPKSTHVEMADDYLSDNPIHAISGDGDPLSLSGDKTTRRPLPTLDPYCVLGGMGDGDSTKDIARRNGNAIGDILHRRLQTNPLASIRRRQAMYSADYERLVGKLDAVARELGLRNRDYDESDAFFIRLSNIAQLLYGKLHAEALNQAEVDGPFATSAIERTTRTHADGV